MEVSERLARKALLRRFHRESTTLGHTFWNVSERTWRSWTSDRNQTDVPQRVIDFIEGEARYDQSRLASPGQPSQPRGTMRKNKRMEEVLSTAGADNVRSGQCPFCHTSTHVRFNRDGRREDLSYCIHFVGANVDGREIYLDFELEEEAPASGGYHARFSIGLLGSDG